MQTSFFDLDDRHNKLNERDPLIALNGLIEWEDFRPTLTIHPKTLLSHLAGNKKA